ncbi:MAG TPA: ATP-binding cassette domain-containing protein, partial [Candidatus Sumerlaeota bacterium]|nr:ATP-binding cassette domain-containing protein [Candidatus Sumerlaeota bacterium]
MNPETPPVQAGAILEVRDLVRHYPLRGGIFRRTMAHVHAVDCVSFTVPEGATLGLVGESGCGKSTLARLLIRLEPPTSGSVRYRDRDITVLSHSELFTLRREIQIIFQDPYSSLNPRMTIGEIIRDPLVVHRIGNRAAQEEKVRSLLSLVGMSPGMMDRYPHEFSGGQRQRIGVARALALDPRVIIADEPVSALDVSVQSQVINLLAGLRRELGLTLVFISHDLSVVEYISDRIAVMYLGRLVEMGEGRDVFQHPAHPYTRALMEAVPVPDPDARRDRRVIPGETPSPINPPPGCHFHPRCPFVKPVCREKAPVLEPLSPDRPDHFASCHRKSEI